GTGLATSFGRIGGILGPLLVPYLIAQNISITIIFTIFCVSILIGAASVLFLGIETKNTEIE
ncbi:MFS transporter, partial [Heyndrickxia oleronia]